MNGAHAFFDRRIALLAIATLLSSVPSLGPATGFDPTPILLFIASCLAFVWLSRDPRPLGLNLLLAGILAVAPTAVAWSGATWRSVSLDNLLTALFSSTGLLYRAPLLWGGIVGLVALRRERPGLARIAFAAIVPGLLSLLVATDSSDGQSLRTLTWLPFLLPGLARCFESARAFATRRPERVLALAGGLLVLWNVLFMEQYRRRLLPSDDTVSFARVTSNSSALLSRYVGTPFAWPANWWFARRFDTTPDRWDGIAGRQLFGSPDAARAVIEVGDDPSVFAIDSALLIEGFGERRTCEQGWCRDLDRTGRLLLPLQDVGTGDLLIRLRVRGRGTLALSLNRAAQSVTDMSETLSDVTLRVPTRVIEPGISVLSLSVSGGDKATIDRFTLERDRSRGSAR